jgi:AcrR family transcriptional regulator
MRLKRSLVNKTTATVRIESPPGDDRRVRRTRQALVQALVELTLEKRYDAITIQNLLDRADVGRSTFYSHYRGKDDLLLKSFEGMLLMLDRSMDRDGPSKRVAPVRELFAHIGGEARTFERALSRARVIDRQYQLGIQVLSRTIERRIVERGATSAVHAGVQARALAGAVIALLRWWIDHDTPYTPEQIDAMVHSMLPA